MNNFSVPIKLIGAAGIMALCSGQFDAFGSSVNSDDLDNQSGKQLVIAKTDECIPGPINNLTQHHMLIIFEEISKVINPLHLTSVCKAWRSGFGLNDNYMTELHYPGMSQFMKRCMNTFWENQFYNGVLHYTPTDGGQVVTLSFSDLQDGTFDLSACGNTGRNFVITTNMDRFCTVKEENEDKTVILIKPYNIAELDWWDIDEAPVGMFGRWGNDEALTCFDSLRMVSMCKFSSRNLYENWRAGSRKWLRTRELVEGPRWTKEMMGFSCQFMKDYMPTFWEKRFYNGVLRYTPTWGGQVVTLPFSDLKDGTFDLSDCANHSQDLVITTNMDRFFTVKGENEDKTVVLITPYHKAKQRINPEHPFAELMQFWDKDEAPVGMFWRWGNDEEFNRFDYLITASMAEISDHDLNVNHSQASESLDEGLEEGLEELAYNLYVMYDFQFNFFKPK